MSNIGFIQFNGRNSYDDLGMKILDKVIIPFPKKKKEKINIIGGDGELYMDLGGYEDLVIPINFEILDKNQIRNKYRLIKRWLDSIDDDHLSLFDDMDFFYKVKDIQVPNNFETMFNIYGVANINFICDPYSYLKEGNIEIDLPPFVYNDTGYKALPTYRIKGEGLMTLIVNSKEIVINVGQEVIIDVDKQLIFREGKIENVRKTGRWEDLELNIGENTFSYSGGRIDEITITPNLRTI